MLNKKQENKILKTIVIIALVQIALLISLPICQGYLIGNAVKGEEIEDSNKEYNEKNRDIINEENNKFFKKSFNSIKKFFSIKQIGTVSAQENSIEEEVPKRGCCVKPSGGGICENVEASECENGYQGDQTDCDSGDYEECTEGYCYNKETGICNPSRGIKCEDPGEFVLSKSSEECQKGCCIKGSNVDWVTQKECELWPGEWFPDVEDELSCHAKTNEEEWGACIYSDGGCDYILGKDCNGEDFVQGEYCSDLSEGETTCGEVENPTKVCKPEINENKVFKLDSCGTPAGVAEECEPGKEMCENGECVSVSCEYEDETYLDGESWCIYESRIGEASPNEDATKEDNKGLEKVSADTPGSTHYMATCHEGEIRVNPCTVSGDRRKICVNDDLEEGETGETFRQASCETNRQSHCLSSTLNYLTEVRDRIEKRDLEPTDDDDEDEVKDKINKIENIKEEETEKLKERCDSNLQCSFIKTDVAGGFGFPSCVGKYPHGTQGCAIGTRSCQVTFVKNAVGRWKCENNCDCLREEFIREMSDHCNSLGDCGSSVNYVGEFSDNSNVEITPDKLNAYLKCGGANCDNNKEGGDPFHNKNDCGTHTSICPKWKQDGSSILKLIKDRYLGFENPSFDGGNEPVPSISKELEELGEDSMISEALGHGFSNQEDLWGMMAGVSGALGILNVAAHTTFVAFYASGYGTLLANVGGLGGLGGAFAGPAIGAFLGAMLGNQIAKWTGQGGEGQLALVISMAVLGAGVGILLTVAWTAALSQAWNPVGWALAIAAAVMSILTVVSGWGKVKTVDVKFNCHEWQAPTGVDKEKCKECVNDELLENFGINTCTEYKCNSIGQNCMILNENSKLNTTCISDEDDETSPVLTPGEIQENHEFEKTGDRNFEIKGPGEDGCVQEESKIWFDIEADEPVQCKYSFDYPSTSYGEMEGNFPATGNNYLENHKFSVDVPNLDTLDLSCVENCDVGEEEWDEISNCMEDCEDSYEECAQECGAPIYEGAEEGHEEELYIKCEDAFGNYNIQEGYIVDMCITRIPDESPPVLERFEPENEKEYKYNPESTTLKMYTHDNSPPIECRWDSSEVSYEEMGNRMGYSGDYLGRHTHKTKLTGLEEGTNTYYIKCNDSKGNIGDYEYQVNILSDMNETEWVLENGLEISSTSVEKREGNYVSEGDNKFLTTERPAKIKLSIQTTEGYNEGESNCEYRFNPSRPWISIYPGEQSSHEKSFNQLYSGGNYSVYIVCRDLEEVSNATKTVNFSLDIDQKGPEINYTLDTNELIVKTNEPSRCYYSDKICNEFEISEGDEFDFGFDFVKEQTSEWNPTWDGYSIKCEDKLGNTNCITYGEIPTEGPLITRIYKSGGNLKLNTDRLAKCYYAFDDCQFDEEEKQENSMSGNYETTHSGEWNSGAKYYLKCEDKWGNWNSCSTVKTASLTQ